MINFSLGLYAGLCRGASGEMGDERANESDYRSKMEIFCEYASLGEFDGAWWSWYATWGMGFCMFFRVCSLRFAELVQAGVEL